MKFKGSQQVLQVKTKKLNGEINDYKFTIKKSADRFLITIPGHGGGREGPQHPDYPEQEKWIRELGFLKEVWYLTWESKDEYQVGRFIRAVEKLG